MTSIALDLDVNNIQFRGQGTANSMIYMYIPQVATSTGTSLQLFSSGVDTQGGYVVGLTSTKELKTHITPITNAVEKIMKFKPITYKVRYNKKATPEEKFLRDNDIRSGFIVEDIEKIDTGLVTYYYTGSRDIPSKESIKDPTNYTLGMYDIYGIISTLTAAVQELIEKVNILEGK